MELITQKIRQCIEKVKDISQVGFDRDYVIKDNKPDVSKVVCQNGQVKVDEIKASGENIWLSGSIEFEVLYTREEVFEGDEPQEDITGNRVEHIKDAIPFQEKLVLQGVERTDVVERNPCGRLQPRLETVDGFAVGHSLFQRIASRTDCAVEPHRPGRQIEPSEIGDRPAGSQRVGQPAVVAAGRDQHDGVERDGLSEV